MAKTIENLFYFSHLGFNLLVVFLFFLFFKRTRKESPLVLVSIYTFLESSLNIFDKFYRDLNLYVYVWSTFTLIEYSLFSYIIAVSIKKPRIKAAILYISICFIVLTLVYNILTHFEKFDSIPIGVETILILLFSFYYLYEQMNDTSNLFIYSKYQFWIIIGFMIYLAGSFFIFIFASGFNSANSSVLRQYWLFSNGFYLLMVLLFSVALIVNNKRFNGKPKKAFPNNFSPYLN